MAHTRESRLTWNREQGAFVRDTKKTTTQRFLRGPVPYEWITHAARLRAFSSYLSHLWFDCGSFFDLII